MDKKRSSDLRISPPSIKGAEKVFGYRPFEVHPKTPSEVNENVKRLISLSGKKTFFRIREFPTEEFFLNYVFSKTDNNKKTELTLHANVLEINTRLNQPTQELVRQILKQSIRKGDDLEANLNVLTGNFSLPAKDSGQLIAVALDEKGCPCLINSRIINKSVETHEVPPEVKLKFVRNHIAGIIPLGKSKKVFLGVAKKIKEIEMIMAEIQTEI